MLKIQSIHPLSDFLRNAKAHVQRLKASKTPEILTVNGRAEIVVQDAESYQALVEEVERARFIESLVVAEKEYEAGGGRSAKDVFAELKAPYEA